MRRIRSKDTGPELKLRSALHKAGYRYRLHAKTLPGCPDIFFPKQRAAIFVHGCFWHGHDCHLFKEPKTRRDFWLAKIGKNQQRDAEATTKLQSLGWATIVVWQCELRDMDRCIARVRQLLSQRPPSSS